MNIITTAAWLLATLNTPWANSAAVNFYTSVSNIFLVDMRWVDVRANSAGVPFILVSAVMQYE